MWRHHFLIALRNFQRNKLTFFINLIGLSSGLACAILIYLWIADEWKIDRFHHESDRLFQVMQNLNRNKSDILTWEWTPGILAKSLKEEIPEVDLAIQVMEMGNPGLVQKDSLQIKGEEIYADEEFFEMFAFPLVLGDKSTVLKEKNNVLLSENLAEKLFGDPKIAVGKTITWKRNRANISGDYFVSGVFANPPTHSTLQFDLVFSYPLFFDNKPGLAQWYNSDPYTFVRLKQGADFKEVNEKITNFIKTKHETSESTLFLKQYSQKYLYGNYENGVQSGGRITYIRLFSLIALFVLVIACINFTNLATAQSATRFKEVGVKKAIGANRGALAIQYLVEALTLSLLALIFSIVLVLVVLPQFNLITGKQLSLQWSPVQLLFLLAISVGTGLLAGVYPAFYLSKFKVVNILRGTLKKGNYGEINIRKGLVVFQFALSIFLIAGVIIVSQQLQFIQNKNLGYEKDNILVLHKEGTIRNNVGPFLNEARKISGVLKASTLDGDMTGDYGYTTTVRWKGYEDQEDPIRFAIMIVGDDILETMGMKLLKGSNFNPSSGQEYSQAIVNETAVKAMGVYDQPIGKTFIQRNQEFEIIGVVQDFHFESLYEEVKPCILKRGTYGNNIYLKVAAGAEEEVITQLKTLYGKFNPGLSFEYKFLDDNFQKLYQGERKVSTLSKIFAALAILICCLGLFGLVVFATERKKKEIGIRKVLGASTGSIVRMLTWEFILLAVIAFVLIGPVCWYTMDRWLQTFAHRISIQWWSFVLAGLSMVVITLLTVGVYSLKAAISNPAESLRQD